MRKMRAAAKSDRPVKLGAHLANTNIYKNHVKRHVEQGNAIPAKDCITAFGGKAEALFHYKQAAKGQYQATSNIQV